MKKFLFFIILIVSLQAYSQTGGSWSGILNTGVPASQIEEMDLLSNRTGLHLVVKNTNTGIIYYRLNTNGSIQQTYNFPNSVGANFPRITGDHNNLSVLYQKDDSIKAYYNPNSGSTWTQNPDIKSYWLRNTISNVSSLEVGFDIFSPSNIRRIHIVLTVTENSIAKAFYTRYYTSQGSWLNDSFIDLDEIGINPTVTTMPFGEKTYFSFHRQNNHSSWTRGFNSPDQHGNWDVAQLAATNTLAEKVFVDYPYLHLFFFDLSNNLKHRRSLPMNYIADPVSVGWKQVDLSNNLLKQNAALYKPKISKTADGYINIIYTASGLFYRNYIVQYVGLDTIDSWSNEFTITQSYVENPPCMSIVSNDIYIIWKDGIPYGGNNYLKLRKYDANPLVPQNLSVSNVNGRAVLSWSSNLEADLVRYRIYRARTTGGTPSENDFSFLDSVYKPNTSFQDPDMIVGSGTNKVFWKISAVDTVGHESNKTNSVWLYYDPEMQKISLLKYEYKLFDCYPHPFNPITKIKFSIPFNESVTLKVYDPLGKTVLNLVNELLEAGVYEIVFDSQKHNLTSGTYFYQFKAGNYTETKKFILLK